DIVFNDELFDFRRTDVLRVRVVLYGEWNNFNAKSISRRITVNGSAGNDSIITGRSDDVIFGNAGDDFIDGGLCADNLFGGDGSDRLQSEDGRDHLVGGPGVDVFDTVNPAAIIFRDADDVA